MAKTVDDYLALITSEHRDKPKFVATITALVQPFVDEQALLESLPTLYDLDVAVGVQLDAVGLWVGRSRYLKEPITNVYFSFDVAGLGFDEGIWKGPFDPDSGLVALPDDAYRVLLKATIAANMWDGTIPTAYATWAILFAGSGITVLIQDNEDMSMLFGLIGILPDALTLALLENGLLNLKPSGVRIAAYVTPTVAATPLFGFDANNSSIAGFDTGAWANVIIPE